MTCERRAGLRRSYVASGFQGGGPPEVAHDNGSNRVFVVDACHVVEALVARNVPQLQFDLGRGGVRG